MRTIIYTLLILATCTVVADEALTPEERIVALTILGEARGEGKRGMYAVACVIQLRSEQRKLTVAQVCHQPWQFSVWNAGNGKIKKERELWGLWDSNMAPYARELARYLCRGYKFVQKHTGSANHYCTLTTNPSWSFKIVTRSGKPVKVPIKPIKVIKNHKFYNL